MKIIEKRTYGNETTIVDIGDLETVRSAMRPNTRLVHIETPGNLTLAVCDIRGIAEIAPAGGALLSVDNTFASPYNQRPLELGADFSVESLTKYINGHEDAMRGGDTSTPRNFTVDFSVSASALKTRRTSSPTWTRP